MPASIRVQWAPNMHETTRGQAVLGAALRFTRFGKGLTNAQRDADLDAELSFHTGFLKLPREEGEPNFELLATLTGKLRLQNTTPVFSAADPSAMVYAVPIPGEDTDVDANDGQPLAKLSLVCAGPNFAASPGLPTELKLPAIPDDARFLEVAVALKVNGAEEAGIDANDRLDVPLDQITFFKVKLEDEEGVPFADEAFELKLVDGSVITGRTDAEGRVKSTPIPRGRCRLRLLFGAPDSGAEDENAAEEGVAADSGAVAEADEPPGETEETEA